MSSKRKKESPAHARYMEGYNKRNHRTRIEMLGVLAESASIKRPDWRTFYTQLYTKLELTAYLPNVLRELGE